MGGVCQERGRQQTATRNVHPQRKTHCHRLGPPVDDYSARIWSGLVKDYYLQRWKHYYDAVDRHETFDFTQWEREWVENYKPAKPAANTDVVKLAKTMVALAKDISTDMLNDKPAGKRMQ